MATKEFEVIALAAAATGATGVLVIVMTDATELEPQLLIANTVTVPVTLPAVIEAAVVAKPEVTAQPAPETDHEYEVAPETEAILNALFVEPPQIFAGDVTEPGVDGTIVGVITTDDDKVEPQLLIAITETVPVTLPAVIEAAVVAKPDVTAQPAPETDHEYEVAPETEAMLNALFVEPPQIFAGDVIEPTVEGILFTVVVIIEEV